MDDDDFNALFDLYDGPARTNVAPNPAPVYSHSVPQALPHMPEMASSTSQIGVGPFKAQLRNNGALQGQPQLMQRVGTATLAAPPHSSHITSIIPSSPHHKSVFGGSKPFQSQAHALQAKSPFRASIHSPASHSSKSEGFIDDIQGTYTDPFGNVDDDDVLAPIPGMSRLVPPAASKKTVRSPPAKRTSVIASPAKTPGRQALNEANDHTITLEGDEPETPVFTTTDLMVDPPICDEEAAKTWHYPTNCEKREYQFSMVQSALFKNSLICLPTGLGKTLIAAVVIYNFYRWFPEGKIIFMAPTKPLVAQQIEACKSMVSIRPEDTIALTGKLSPDVRAMHWTSKRIFFVTPQVPQNDIRDGIVPTEKICLLVFDEAHKAQGDFSYCEVIRAVARVTPYFRVLALSATPGGTAAAIQEVLTNLLVSKIELRTDESPDVKPYLHTRHVEEINVPMDSPLLKAKELLRAIINVPIDVLQKSGALYRLKQGQVWSFNRLQAAKEAFVREQNNRPGKDQFWYLSSLGNFSTAMAMFHGMHLISDYGMAQFKEWINTQARKPMMEEVNKSFEALVKSREFSALLNFVNNEIGDASAVKHPKMLKLEDVVLKHFESLDGHNGAGCGGATLNLNFASAQPPSSTAIKPKDTRVMIFAQYRDTVEDIIKMLERHAPTVRAMPFVGQANKGLTQKQQAEVVQRFREGHYNTLVATSIGEEGLDIGEVDLIVCYDTQQSPIRMIQRMGRTGRKRNGRCVMLLTTGSEDVSFKRSKAKSKEMIKAISSRSRFHFFGGAQSTHLLPPTIHSEPHLVFMEPVPETVVEAAPPKRKSRAKKSAATDASTSPPAKTTTSSVANKNSSMQEDIKPDITPALQPRSPNQNTAPFVPPVFEIDSDDDYIEQLLQDNTSSAFPSTHTTTVSHGYAPASTKQPEPAIPPTRPVEHISNINERQHSSNIPPSSGIPVLQSPITLPTTSSSAMIKTSIPTASNVTAAAPSLLPPSKPVRSILDQSQSSIDSAASLFVPLTGFPEGFFDDPLLLPPRAAPLSSTSASNGFSLPPPPPSVILLDYELGFQTLPGMVPPPQLVHQALPPRPHIPGPSSSTSTSVAGHMPVQEKNTLVFHAKNQVTPVSAPTRPTTMTTSSPAAAATPISSTPPSSPSLFALSSTSSTPLDISFQSAATPAQSPHFRRLKRAREDDEDDLELSPPKPKKSAPAPRARRRFLQEEASMDDDNSDGSDYSGDEPEEDEMPTSQDLAFIAPDQESVDTSTTRMRTVYAKSLSSQATKLGMRKPKAVDESQTWIDGSDLAAKMRDWAEYSDYECTSDLNSSYQSLDDSIIMDVDESNHRPTTSLQKTAITHISISSTDDSPVRPSAITTRPPVAQSSIPPASTRNTVIPPQTSAIQSVPASLSTTSAPSNAWQAANRGNPSSFVPSTTSPAERPLRLGLGLPSQQKPATLLPPAQPSSTTPAVTNYRPVNYTTSSIRAVPQQPTQRAANMAAVAAELLDGLTAEDFM